MRSAFRSATAVVFVVVAAAAPASAHGSFAFAVDPASAPRPSIAVGFGIGPQPVGFEVEYAATAGHHPDSRTSVGTIGVSALVATPWRIHRAPVYLIAGFGVYGETGGGSSSGEASAVHVGAGITAPLAGSLKLRLEYRAIGLKDTEGAVASRHPQRLLAGITVGF